jgi:hypothetical protein
MDKKLMIEELNRIKSLMGLINEQVSSYGFWDDVIDFFMPGTPVKDGRDLLKNFDDIIKRRIEYNKKKKLPLDTLTPEERSFRNKIFNATPPSSAPYPDILGLTKIIQDINLGKNIQTSEFEKYRKNNPNRSENDIEKIMSSGDELKKMWLGLDEPGGETKGYWIKSEFRPKDSTDPKAIYFKPKNIPKLSTQQFDELYNAILKTKLPNGKFPGGNSDTVFKYSFKFLPKNFLDDLESDLGNFKFGASEENGKKYISIYDEWDLVPPSAQKFGVDVQKYGKTTLIYFRIYRQ